MELRRLYGMRDEKRKNFYGISAFLYVLMLAAFCALGFSVFFSNEAHAAGFVLKKTDSGYEPEAYEVVMIPGTKMRAGTFRFITDKDIETAKAGVLVNNKVLYYVDSEGEESGPVDAGGDCNHGFYNGYFMMDCSAFGASYNRRMLLFRLGTDDIVDFLDMVGADLSDFITVTEDRPELRVKVSDIDKDGNPEIPLMMIRSHHTDPAYDFKIHNLYLEIRNGKLIVEFNPALYSPLFEEEKRKNQLKRKPDAYYIYGFLAKELSLDRIKSALKPRGELYEGQYESIVPLLESRDKWNAAFHYYYGAKPVLKKYEIGK